MEDQTQSAVNAETSGQAVYEVWRAAIPDFVCNVPAGKWEDLPETVRAGFDAVAAQEPHEAPDANALARQVQEAWDKAFSRPSDTALDYRMARLAVETVHAAPGPAVVAAERKIRRQVSELGRLVPLGRHATPQECDAVHQAVHAIVMGG
jgi:hypothetical protein